MYVIIESTHATASLHSHTLGQFGRHSSLWCGHYSHFPPIAFTFLPYNWLTLNYEDPRNEKYWSRPCDFIWQVSVCYCYFDEWGILIHVSRHSSDEIKVSIAIYWYAHREQLDKEIWYKCALESRNWDAYNGEHKYTNKYIIYFLSLSLPLSPSLSLICACGQDERQTNRQTSRQTAKYLGRQTGRQTCKSDVHGWSKYCIECWSYILYEQMKLDGDVIVISSSAFTFRNISCYPFSAGSTWL